MHRIDLRKKFLQKPNFINKQTCLGTNQGVFQKEETNEYLNWDFENCVTNVEFM